MRGQPALGVIFRRTLPLEVAERVGKAIVGGLLIAGSALPSEVELRQQFGVSRSVLREAFKVLAEKGLIAARPKSGTTVLPASQWNTLDVDVLGWRLGAKPSVELINNWFDFRQQFEPYAARRATERADPDDLHEITEAARRFSLIYTDIQQSIEADIQLHQAILIASGNEFFVPLGRSLEGALRASFALSTHRLGAREGAVPLHQHVVDAIVGGDAAEAERSMTYLIEASREDLLWVIDERNATATDGSRRKSSSGKEHHAATKSL